MTKEHHVSQAQLYVAELNRREDARNAARDYKMERWVIVLIAAELVLAVIGIITGWREGNNQIRKVDKQIEILDTLNRSSAATADTLTAVRQAQEASLDTQEHTLDNIVAMNTALHDELVLNYAVSIALTYDESRPSLDLHNEGKTNLFLWGDKLDEQPPSIEKEPRIIAPGGFYFIHATDFKRQVIDRQPKGLPYRATLYLYLKSANGKKYVAKSYLIIRWEGETAKVDTQMISVTAGW